MLFLLGQGKIPWLCSIFEEIYIKDEQIKIFSVWPELHLIQDIKIFFEFTNFYYCLI